MSSAIDSSMIQENIEEYVNDENKIVTCRWLSLTLNIHINIAKQALYTYVTVQRNKGGNDDVNVTYFVAGLGQSKSGEPEHKCVVVPESHLDVIKSGLKTVTSCHVYSVQKVKLKDTIALYQTDYDIIKENVTVSPSLSSIQCPWAVMRDLSKVKSTKLSTVDSSKSTSKPSVAPNVSPATVTNGKGSKSEPVQQAANKKKAEPKGSIASMFSSAGKKAGGDGQKAAVPDKTQTNKQKSKTNDKKGGMMAFMTAQPKDNTVKKPEVPKLVEKKKSEVKEKSKEVKEKTKEKPSRKSKKKDNSDDDEPPKKSRRRIRTDLFDSSSDENDSDVERKARGISDEEEEVNAAVEEEEVNVAVQEEEEEDVDLIESSISEEKEKTIESKKVQEKEDKPSSPPANGSRKRKRTKKLVPKQYVDEEGFMVTEKVWESESTDASDTETTKNVEQKDKAEKIITTEVKKTENKQTTGQKAEAKGKTTSKKPSVTSPQKGKQTSMLSFFKKK